MRLAVPMLAVPLLLTALSPGCARATPAGAPDCRRSGATLVVSQAHPADVGDVIVVKTGTPDHPPSCSVNHGPGDWVIDSKDDALYVLRLQAPLLILDSGTGPTRSLRVYAIDTRKLLFKGLYDNTRAVRVAVGSLTFWMADGLASPSNCPNYRTWIKQGFDVLRTYAVRLSANGAPPLRTGGTGCMASQ